ncbi:unnamed protein product [Cercospora beticola]|nr:unnamed protein product [Cercospora beticola]
MSKHTYISQMEMRWLTCLWNVSSAPSPSTLSAAAAKPLLLFAKALLIIVSPVFVCHTICPILNPKVSVTYLCPEAGTEAKRSLLSLETIVTVDLSPNHLCYATRPEFKRMSSQNRLP